MTTTHTNARVPLGHTLMTCGVNAALGDGTLRFSDLMHIMARHEFSDWGDVCPEDAAANVAALANGDRILSSYDVRGTKVWIITEADRSVTTILLPEEY